MTLSQILVTCVAQICKMYNIWSNIGLKSLKNLTKTLKNLTITLKYLTKNFEKLDNFAEKNAEGVIITPKKGLYETLSYFQGNKYLNAQKGI